MRITALLAAVATFLIFAAAPHAHAMAPAGYCRSVGTDDTLRPIPRSLVPAAVRLFGLSAMPAEVVQHTTYFRCFDDRVLVCNVGANLPCGKADTSRHLTGANHWCAAHPDSDFIPLYVTGHDTIYRWRCREGKAAVTATPFKVDPRGFITRFWKPADP